MKLELIQNLHKILADLRVLTIKSQMYHWNVKSKDFYSLHKMFQKHYEELFANQDIVAEDIRSLGFFVNFDKINMDSSEIRTDNINEKNSSNIILNLIEDYKVLEKKLKLTISLSQKCDEEAVANNLAEILGFVQKTIWFLNSHCE